MNKPPVGRQFSFWGDEAPQEPEVAPEAPRPSLAGRSKTLKRSIGESYSLRERDDAVGLQVPGSLPAGRHDPRTGLPNKGTVSTSHIPGMAPLGSGEKTPGWASFHTLGLGPRLQGDLSEMPLQRNDYGRITNVVRAGQPDVSSRRVKQIMDDPSSGRTPRLPATAPSNVPVVFQHSPQSIPNVVDGHHRISAALVKNNTPGEQMEMFTPVRKFTPEHEGRTRDAEMRMYTAYGNAREKRMNRPPSKNVKPVAVTDSRSYGGLDAMFQRFDNDRARGQ